MKTLEERLYLLRRENKLTQEEIAGELKVTRQTVSNWETGNAKPTIDKAIDLAKIYDVSLDVLVGNAKAETKHISGILKDYKGAFGTLLMHPSEEQPFFPHGYVKNVEILKIEATSIKIRIHKDKTIDQFIFIKDIMGFIKERE